MAGAGAGIKGDLAGVLGIVRGWPSEGLVAFER
jgi:hypothetical protein